MEKNDKLKAEEIPGAGIEQEESEELDEYAERPLPGCYYIPDHYQPPAYSELKNNTDYPNLNSEDFRSRDPGPDKNLLYFYEHLEQNSDGNFLLATNSYFDRFLTGNIFGFDEFSDIESLEKCKFTTSSTGGTITSLKFISPLLFIFTSADSGIELWSTRSAMRDPDGYCLFKIGHSYDLPGMAKDMKLLNNESKAITGSSFGTIQMWDYGTGDVKSVQTINYAHPSSVNGISISPTSNQEFVSCSSDKSVLVWDLRAGKPGARAVYEFHEAIFNSVHWGTDLENGSMIQAGDMGGRIYSFDLKMPGKIVSVLKVTEGKNQRPIRKFVYRGSDMAVVDHSCVARVYSKTREKPMEFSGNGPLIYDFLWDKLDENLCYVVGEKRYSKKLKIVEDQIVEC